MDPKNRRRNTIAITEKALDIKEEVYQILMLTTKKLFTGFSQRQIEIYFESTEQINTTVKAMLEQDK